MPGIVSLGRFLLLTIKMNAMKSAECKKVLQLMDEDYSYRHALNIVLSENNKADKIKLEEELDLYI